MPELVGSRIPAPTAKRPLLRLKMLRSLVDLVGIEPTTSPAKPGRAQANDWELLINSAIERCDFQLFSCRSRRRAAAKLLNGSW